MTLLYGYGNNVTDSGSYTLVPAVPVLGVISLGGAGATFSGKIDSNGNVTSETNASVNFTPSLISLANPWNVTSQKGAVVTVTGLTGGAINALTGATFNADGGTIAMSDSSAISALSGSTYNISNGGTLVLNDVQGQSAISALGGSSVNFGDGGGTLLIMPGSNVSIIAFKTIKGFDNPGSTIEIPGATKIVSVSNNNGNTNILTDNGKTITVQGNFYDYTTQNNLYQSTQNGNLYISSTPQNNTGTDGVLVCFLSGSMIRTPKGDVAVEDIQIGDKVIAFDWKNNKDIVRPVVWVGKARAVVRPELPDDEAGWPVRILKDAIADGVPYKDMLITAEHCLFFKDRFVPVRMLVNGVSIFYDKSITSYDYYHVETEQHSVITADGMLTESYLDTGNRSSFRQEGRIATLRGATKSWENDAGAPLGVERSFVEPLFRAIEWREDKVSAEQAPAAPELTSDPDPHLVTDAGAIVRPMRKTAHEYSFMLPPSTRAVRIVSRASRPSDVIGPFVDDRRFMGVAIADIRLACAKKVFEITSHLQTEKPEGWHADMGWEGVAWTNGNAELPLGDHLAHGKMGILSMTVCAAGPYIKDNQTATKSANSA